MVTGDSGEYEFLTKAVEVSAPIEGMCLELGVRRGLGTKTILDAVRLYCPDKMVIALDCYGSIEYVCREPDGPVRLDYTNQMKADCMVDLWTDVRDNPVSFRFECLTDKAFFKKYKKGVPRYDIETKKEKLYSMVHFDGPHTVNDILMETKFFHKRSIRGACFVYDDITPDFYNHDIIDNWLIQNGYELLKMGVKKALYRKL